MFISDIHITSTVFSGNMIAGDIITNFLVLEFEKSKFTVG